MKQSKKVSEFVRQFLARFDGAEVRRVAFASNYIDMGCERGHVLVEQKTGNIGLGIIVLVFTSIPLFTAVPISFWQAFQGTASGNPLAAAIIPGIVLSWPFLWSLAQFFRYRRFYIDGDCIHFEFEGLLRGRREVSVKLQDYKRLSYGWSSPTSSCAGPVGGSSGYFYLSLWHKKWDYRIKFYSDVEKCLPDERIRAYSERLGMPAVCPDREELERVKNFSDRVDAFMERRKKPE